MRGTERPMERVAPEKGLNEPMHLSFDKTNGAIDRAIDASVSQEARLVLRRRQLPC
ncbi:MAG: hypothetical protein ACOC4Y_01595 [bacterium]